MTAIGCNASHFLVVLLFFVAVLLRVRFLDRKDEDASRTTVTSASSRRQTDQELTTKVFGQLEWENLTWKCEICVSCLPILYWCSVHVKANSYGYLEQVVLLAHTMVIAIRR